MEYQINKIDSEGAAVAALAQLLHSRLVGVECGEQVNAKELVTLSQSLAVMAKALEYDIELLKDDTTTTRAA